MTVTTELIGNKSEDAKTYITVRGDLDLISAEGDHLDYLKTRKTDGKRAEFVYDQWYDFKSWNESFWLPSEEVELLMSILQHVKTPPAKQLQPHLQHLSQEKQTIVCAQTHLINALRIAGIVEVSNSLYNLLMYL